MATATAAPPPTTSAIDQARRAQSEWGSKSIDERLRAVQAVRESLVDDARDWADEITDPRVRTVADSLAAEVLPTADACRFLIRNAKRILKDQRGRSSDKPIWGRGLKVRTSRAPRGVVLVIGAGNYPLYLAAVQTLQALVAGNAVLIKPAPGASAPMVRLRSVLTAAGLPGDAVQVLDESAEAAQTAIAEGVDHIMLTGSAETGRAVLRAAAETITPCTVELSGCDAVFVLPGADLKRVAAAVAFGLKLNGGATCIGPKRLFVPARLADELIAEIQSTLPAIPATVLPPHVAEQAEGLIEEAIAAGAEPITAFRTDASSFGPVVLDTQSTDLQLLRADLFAPVMSIIRVADSDEALAIDRDCPYALGASVFGPAAEAEQLAQQLDAGCVTINDLVAPTADPRVAFGGTKQSGYGVTRGELGLFEMTRPRTVVTQTAGWLPHLDPPREKLDQLLLGLIRLGHGTGLGEKWRGLRDVIAGARSRTLPINSDHESDKDRR
ncbi:MAG: aldehyde dehydrogenase family protein [Planctomycetota bacterium]